MSYEDPTGYAPGKTKSTNAKTTSKKKDGEKSKGEKIGEALKEARERRAKKQGYGSYAEKKQDKQDTKKSNQKAKADDLSKKGKTKRAARVTKRMNKK